MSRPVLIRFQRMYKSVNLSVESGIHQDGRYVTDVKQNHLISDTDLCDAYREDLSEIEVFAKGPFSNFANCKMKMDGLLFPTSEHA